MTSSPALLANLSDDLGNWTGLGAGAVLLVLIFRTLWKFAADSSELARNYDAALERAQADAAEARAEASKARQEAAEAERKVLEEQRRAVELETTLRRERLELETDLRRKLADLELEVATLRRLIHDRGAGSGQTGT